MMSLDKIYKSWIKHYCLPGTNLPAHVFNFDEPGVMKKICLGEHVGTLINDDVTMLVHEK